MHPKLNALLERLGKTLEQVKADHASEYLATLEDIARESQPSTEGASQVGALQTQVTALQAQLSTTQAALRESEGRRAQEARTAMVDTALQAANLPVLDPLELNGERIDLNAQWREGLLASALAAESDEAAKALVAQQIAIRAHELATHKNATESVAPTRVQTPPAPPAPTLPVGNNDRGSSEYDVRVEGASAGELMGNPYVSRLRG